MNGSVLCLGTTDGRDMKLTRGTAASSLRKVGGGTGFGTYLGDRMECLPPTWILDNFDADRNLDGISIWDPDTLMEKKAKRR